MTPRRRTILQCSHIFLTDALTFMLKIVLLLSLRFVSNRLGPD